LFRAVLVLAIFVSSLDVDDIVKARSLSDSIIFLIYSYSMKYQINSFTDILPSL
jgi:hypothetical protein